MGMRGGRGNAAGRTAPISGRRSPPRTAAQDYSREAHTRALCKKAGMSLFFSGVIAIPLAHRFVPRIILQTLSGSCHVITIVAAARPGFATDFAINQIRGHTQVAVFAGVAIVITVTLSDPGRDGKSFPPCVAA